MCHSNQSFYCQITHVVTKKKKRLTFDDGLHKRYFFINLKFLFLLTTLSFSTRNPRRRRIKKKKKHMYSLVWRTTPPLELIDLSSSQTNPIHTISLSSMGPNLSVPISFGFTKVKSGKVCCPRTMSYPSTFLNWYPSCMCISIFYKFTFECT